MDDYKKIIKAISDKNIPAPGYFSRTKCDICENFINAFIGWWHDKKYKFSKYPKINC